MGKGFANVGLYHRQESLTLHQVLVNILDQTWHLHKRLLLLGGINCVTFQLKVNVSRLTITNIDHVYTTLISGGLPAIIQIER